MGRRLLLFLDLGVLQFPAAHPDGVGEIGVVEWMFIGLSEVIVRTIPAATAKVVSTGNIRVPWEGGASSGPSSSSGRFFLSSE